MFPKNQRVTKKSDFDLIFKKGKSFHSPFLTIKILDVGLGKQRFAVLVSKKVSNKAVDRNTVKRTLREVIKKNIKLFPAQSDVVIYAQPKALNLSLQDATTLIQKILKKP